MKKSLWSVLDPHSRTFFVAILSPVMMFLISLDSGSSVLAWILPILIVVICSTAGYIILRLSWPRTPWVSAVDDVLPPVQVTVS
jgi:hypothetical protein